MLEVPVGLFQIKIGQRNFVLTFKSVPEFLRPMFGQPLGHEHNILSAKSLNIFSSLAVYEQSNSPPSAAWCQIPHPHSGSKVKFPTPGEREGVKCPWYARGGGEVGMLRLHIDRCIAVTSCDTHCLHFHITVRVLSVYCGDFKFTIFKD